jgi:amino acid adenylation domain-containing protein/non-ribosomal peptide synthase protein (TIGR01720 family)
MQTSQTSLREEPTSCDQGFRLSYQQRRLWLHARNTDAGGQRTAVPNAQCGLRIEGELDRARLRQALQKTIDRHEILRTSFPIPAGLNQPVQVVAPHGSADWREVDLRLCTQAERDAQIESCRVDDLREAFDLAQDPLLRASLLTLAESEHLLILTLPGLCADAATLQNLARELCSAYCRDPRGEEPEDIIQYVQLAEWQQSLQDGEDAEHGREHWRAQKTSPALVLPLQRASRGAVDFISASCVVPIAPQIAGWLRCIERADVFLLGCWLTLLGRVSGQPSVRAGFTSKGRSYEELQAAMGPVARVVPVGCTLQAGLRFSELLASLATAVDEADDWQEYYERSIDEEPYEDAGFECSEWLPLEPLSGLRIRLAFQQSCAERFHLKLALTGAGDELFARIDYDPQILAAEYVERLAAQLSTVVGVALANPDALVEELPLLGADERHFVIEECNETRADYPSEACLHQLFAAQAARTPHQVAVRFEDASLTYDELDKRANQLAHRLRELKVGPEVRVGVFMHRSLEMMIGLLGILKAGGAYVPLDPAYPTERLTFMLADSQVPVLLTDRRLRSLVPSADEMEVLCLDDPFEQVAGKQPTHEQRNGVCSSNLAYALYTSGSTGQPKGALITHRGLINYLTWCSTAYDVESGAGTAVHSSIGFDATITALFPPLLVGRSVELLRESEGVDGLAEAMRRSEGFSLIKITPAHLSLLNEVLTEGGLAEKTRLLVIGGDALAGGRLSAWRQHGPKTRFINEYGPTETVVGCCVHEACEADLAGESVPMGRPIANTQLYVLDSRLSPLPTGIPGELFIGGDGVARGYLGRPALTAERFLPDALSGAQGARMYRTGDLTVRQPDGILNFLGRLDHQVKIRSYRVELGEIEAQLEQHADVTRCVVTAHADASGEKSLVAFVQLTNGKAPTTDELRSFLLGRLPEHMTPAIFVTLDALPLTAHGKVDRDALPDWKTVRANSGPAIVAPRTPAEETLAAIWQKALKLEYIGIHDDFFRSGGDSILSILVVARAAKAGLRFTTRDLFQHPTIAELAAIASTSPDAAPAQGVVDGEAPLTPIQHWFFERELSEPHHFNQAVLLDMLPEVRADLLRRALDELVLQHDALRLRFTQETTGWRQAHAAAEGTAVVCEVDLAGLSASEQQATLNARANEAQASLNLSQGPLLRAVLFHYGHGAPSRLLLTIHHLVVDGVSWRILLDDLATAYQQLTHNEPVRLPAKTASFKEWATRLEQQSGSAALTTEAGYWLQQFAATAPLPVDLSFDVDANTVAASDRVRVALDRRQTSTLLHEVSDVYRTQVDDLLLTALVQACERWTGSRSLSIDMEGHGRPGGNGDEALFADLDVTRTVGWFTSIYPVHLHLDGSGPGEELKAIPGEALKAIKEQLRQVPHRGIGYGLLRYLCPDASLRARLATLPQAQVSFNYLGSIDGLASDPILGVANEMAGAEEGPHGRRPYLLDVIGQVTEGSLQLEIVYSTAVHRRATVEKLAGNILSCIESLLEHCLSPEAGGFTPSDFPEAGLSQEELDGLVADLG